MSKQTHRKSNLRFGGTRAKLIACDGTQRKMAALYVSSQVLEEQVKDQNEGDERNQQGLEDISDALRNHRRTNLPKLSFQSIKIPTSRKV